MTLPTRVGCFGKLPTFGDFVRHGEETPWRRELFDWFVEGWSRSLAGGRMRDLDRRTFAVAPTGDGRAVALCAQPSRDQVGRRFPFVVHAEFDLDLRQPGQALQAAWTWLEQAVPICELAARGAAVAEAKAHVASLAARALRPEAATAYAGWCDATPANQTLRRGAHGTFADWLRGAEFALSTGGTPEFVVRGHGAASLHELGFAVDLLHSLGMKPLQFVAFDETPDRGWRFRALSQRLAPRYLAPLYWGDAPSESAWDIAPERDNVPAKFVSQLVPRLDLANASVQATLEAAHG